jgi:hypothetical protein
MSELDTNLANREHILSRLRSEIVGPDPCGTPVTLTDKQALTWEEFRLARRQLNGEEIVWQDSPTRRFGAGILFPLETNEQVQINAAAADDNLGLDSSELANVSGDEKDAPGQLDDSDRGALGFNDAAGEDDEVTLANAFQPSALGMSFLADLGAERVGIAVELVSLGRIDSSVVKEGACGVYKPISLNVGGLIDKKPISRKVWLRQPIINPDGTLPFVLVSSSDLLSQSAIKRVQIGPTDLQLEIVIVARSWHGAPTAKHRLLTITLVNRKRALPDQLDLQCIFQAGFRVRGQSDALWIDAYPENLITDHRDADPLADENVNRVLYRENRTFGVGHGCSVDWTDRRPIRVANIWTDVLPVFETPTTSADLFIDGPDGAKRPLRVSMRLLAGLDSADDGFSDITRLLDEYAKWIQSLDSKVSTIDEVHRPTASALIQRSRDCEGRIRDGLAFLRETGAEAEVARKAFRLANHAMLSAQWRARLPLRLPVRDASGRLAWAPAIREIDETEPSSDHGYWRPFQIAFLLMSLRGICDSSHTDRETVDLIWFPTGGGKTEAYLGLTAFTVFFNAISKISGKGVDVLMRYTLRLLTAQQFQRAATLFCAMERLRCRDVTTLGDRPFSIGLWVGGAATPNKRTEALVKLKALQKDPDAENPYVLLRCPWCAAKFGPHDGGSVSTSRTGFGRARGSTTVPVYGYVKHSTVGGDTVVYRCNDAECSFGGLPGSGTPPLPIVVIDEDLFQSPPNLLIGTVDKFAMLAWKPEARAIFGLDKHGLHRGAPPTLIIQDELHLISGPLGSMVGAYEMVIEALCVDPLGGLVRPKIVASTATISRAREQVEGLYGRNNVLLFPPSGLDASDSFFARDAVDEDGRPTPGRLYVGVLAPAHTSLQTSMARVFATLMQHASLIEGEAKVLDPWWTLLVFFNSLRELGGAATLFSADVREYLKVILNRHGVDYSRIRQLFHVEELTSRIRSDHIPKLLERLEDPLVAREGTPHAKDAPAPIDVCLASSIIEVGVDIPRLSLMAIVGQPKTTSQYIQVSSRIGREQSRPGMVVVIYGQTKPRDRSHYEKFRSYHQRLYAQVEPTSVTPFSPPAIDRALHGLVVALVRQLSDHDQAARTPDPFPLSVGSEMRVRIEEIVRERVHQIAPEEEARVMTRLQQRLSQWKAWNPDSYGGFGKTPVDAPLMHPAGSSEPAQWGGRSWSTMSSLRNVDASCEGDLTTKYQETDQEII